MGVFEGIAMLMLLGSLCFILVYGFWKSMH